MLLMFGMGGLVWNGLFEWLDVCFDWSRGSCARVDCRFSYEGEVGGNFVVGGVMGCGVGLLYRVVVGVCFDYVKGMCKWGD